MDEKEFKALCDKVGEEAAKQIRKDIGEAKAEVEKNLNEAFEKKMKGQMTEAEFKSFKESELKKITDEIATHGTKYEELLGIVKEQGTEMARLKESAQKNAPGKTFEQYMKDDTLLKQIKDVYRNGSGNVELDLKTAGVSSIGNSILPVTNPAAPNNPFLPVAGPLDVNNFFGLIYNPNFITNYVSQGRTDSPLLPWINETSPEGGAAAVQEGAPKPLWNTKFTVEFSKPKKIAAMTVITEEFDQDLPGFTTIIKRLLQQNVARLWDDNIYAGVIAAATGYTITGLNGSVSRANYWDVLRSGIAQIGANNYTANFIGLNPVMSALVDMQKSAADRLYLLPGFKERIQAILHEGNKVAMKQMLVGDITQYNVDLYKDFVIKVGWNNDDFQRNQFSVIAEVRYHDYISSNRKAGLLYANMDAVKAQITTGS